MSSIYRKGRDGYYYYQTYVYNAITKKKDKRIFHSLGTKNKIEARQKQIKYDNQYSKKNNKLNFFKISNFNIKAWFIILTSLTLPLILINYLSDSFREKQKKNNIVQIQKNAQKKNKTDYLQDSISYIKTEKTIKIDSVSKNYKNLIVPEVTIPEYIIHRIDRYPGKFSQGKIYVTTDKNINKQNQKQICSQIKNRYSEFSNLIICIYSSDNAGVTLAKGLSQNLNVEKRHEAWLALYTFNKVEGEFFDNNPGGYSHGF